MKGKEYTVCRRCGVIVLPSNMSPVRSSKKTNALVLARSGEFNENTRKNGARPPPRPLQGCPGLMGKGGDVSEGKLGGREEGSETRNPLEGGKEKRLEWSQPFAAKVTEQLNRYSGTAG